MVLVGDEGKLRRQLGQTDYGQGVPGTNSAFTLAISPVAVWPEPNRQRTAPRQGRFRHGRAEQYTFVSEILQGAPDDLRGIIWVDDPGAGSYMTRFTPNGYLDIIGRPGSTWTTFRRLPPHGSGNEPRHPPARSATANPSSGWPVTPRNQGLRIRGFAQPASRRRQHPLWRRLGPLHQKLDQLLTWIGLGSITGGEVISSDSY